MKYQKLTLLLLFICACAAREKESIAVTMQDIDLVTTDQTTLRGTFFTHDQRGPGILLMHQCMDGSDRTTWTDVAQSLVNKGFHVLTFDFRGYGESSGEWPAFSTMPEFIEVCRNVISNDVNAAYRFLANQEKVDPSMIGVGGASCGVFMGIDLAFQHDDIKTMVLLSGPYDSLADQRLRAMNPIPLLMAASEKDTRAFEAMKRVFAASENPSSTFIQLKGDKHGTFMFESDMEFVDIITRWYERWLLPEDSNKESMLD